MKSPEDFAEGDYRKYLPRFQSEAFYKNLELVNGFQKVAEAKGVSNAQLTLAWVMKQGPCIIPIPGTRSMSRLDENWASKDVVITDEENQLIRDIINQIEIVGSRYHERSKAFVDN